MLDPGALMHIFKRVHAAHLHFAKTCLLLVFALAAAFGKLDGAENHSSDHTDKSSLSLVEVKCLRFSNAQLSVLSLQNTGAEPIKAFRVQILRPNDFGETVEVAALEYSSESNVIEGGIASGRLRHGAILQVGDHISFSQTAFEDGRIEEHWFLNSSPPKNVSSTGRGYILRIIKVVNAGANDVRSLVKQQQKEPDLQHRREKQLALSDAVSEPPQSTTAASQARSEDRGREHIATQPTTSANIPINTLNPEKVVIDVWDKNPEVTLARFQSRYSGTVVKYTGTVVRINRQEQLVVFKGGGFVTSAYDVQARLTDGRKPGFEDIAVGDRLTIVATLDRLVLPAFGIGSNSLRLSNGQVYGKTH